MNSLAKLTVATTLMLSAAFGVASAQQANAPDQSPPANCANGNDNQCDDNAEMGMGGGHGRHHGQRGNDSRHGGMMGRHGGHGMRIIDANNDGVIGEDEAASLADFDFQRRDDNGDGKLTEAEFIGGPKAMHGWFDWNSTETAAIEKLRKENFAKLDLNKDANLDKNEFFADAKAKLAAADADKDGKVTPWEFRAAR